MKLSTRTQKRKLTAEERRTIALEHCQQGWNSFRETVTQGEQLCLPCGKKAYCPRCLLAQLGTFLKLCATHRTQQHEGGNQ